MSEIFKKLRDEVFGEDEWLDISYLARERGFEVPRANRREDGTFIVKGGLTDSELLTLRDEVMAGGWTYLPRTRKRHYFRKPGSLFDNPSLCRRHHLGFYTRLEHDAQDDDKCAACLRKYRILEIKQVFCPTR